MMVMSAVGGTNIEFDAFLAGREVNIHFFGGKRGR